MADKITTEFLSLDDTLGGEPYFDLAESYQIHYFAAEIQSLKNSHPDLRYHIISGDTEQVTEKLDKGVIDFAVLAEEPNTDKYHDIPRCSRQLRKKCWKGCGNGL